MLNYQTKVPLPLHFSLPPDLSSAMDATSPPSPTTSLPDGQQLVPVSTRHGSSGSGSIGPFFAVMSVIIILSALSCIFGRYCASWSEGPDAWYDCLGWARRRWGGGGGRCALGCCMGREVTSAVAENLHPKVGESKQLPLSSPQAE